MALKDGKKPSLHVSHFRVVVLFFGPCMFTYTCPVAIYLEDRWVTMFFAILSSTLNLIIYTVRNREVKKAMWNLLKQRVT